MNDNTTGAVTFVDPRDISSTSGSKSSIGQVQDTKEENAGVIALIISITFAASAGLLLFGLYFVLRRAPADAKTLLEAATPVLKEAGTFLSSVFGPLLAFVLGYYFSEKKSANTNN